MRKSGKDKGRVDYDYNAYEGMPLMHSELINPRISESMSRMAKKRRKVRSFAAASVATVVALAGCFLFLCAAAIVLVVYSMHHQDHTPPHHAGNSYAAPTLAYATEDSMSVKWALDSSSSVHVVGYVLEESDGASGDTFVPVCGKRNQILTSCLVANLLGSHEYCFRVTAYTSFAVAAQSEVACFTTEAPLAPGAPAAPQLVLASDTMLSLQLAIDNVTHGSPIEVYIVSYCYPYPDCTDSRSALVDPASLVVNLTSLPDNTVVAATIQAENSAGLSPPSPQVTFHTNKPGATVPTVPLRLNVSNIQSTGADASWTPPSSDGGSNVLNYLLYVSLAHDPSNPQVITTNHLSVRLNNLKVSTSYEVQVSAVNSIGSGPFSDPVTFTTSTAGVPSTPEPPAYINDTSTTLIIEWKPPHSDGGAPLTKYCIYNGKTSTVFFCVSSNSTNGTVTGLDVSTSYVLQLTACNAVGCSLPSATVTFTTGGACFNPVDIAVFVDNAATFASKMRPCGVKCRSDISCETACVEKTFTTMTTPCATCQGTVNACGAHHCSLQCMLNSKSSTCLDCIYQYCTPAYHSCAGLPPWDYPPP